MLLSFFTLYTILGAAISFYWILVFDKLFSFRSIDIVYINTYETCISRSRYSCETVNAYRRCRSQVFQAYLYVYIIWMSSCVLASMARCALHIPESTQETGTGAKVWECEDWWRGGGEFDFERVWGKGISISGHLLCTLSLKSQLLIDQFVPYTRASISHIL